MKNIKGLLFVLISFPCFSIYSHAAQPNNNDKPYLYPDIYSQCKNGQSEQDIDNCVATEINKALNYLAEIESEYKKSKPYEKSAISWLEFVSSTCEFENSQFFGANGSGMASRRFSECRFKLIIYRINVIKKYIACQNNAECNDNVPSLSKIITSKQ